MSDPYKTAKPNSVTRPTKAPADHIFLSVSRQSQALRHKRWAWLGSVVGGCVMLFLMGMTAGGESGVLSRYTASAELDDQGRAIARPALADETYAQIAATLRAQYSQPQGQWPTPTTEKGVAFVELGLVPATPHPADNPYSKEKAELGMMLFFDPRLSGSRQMACASCHDPDLAWTDGRTVAFGNQRRVLKRNSPSLLNVGHATSLFWDGRAATLEDQAMEVILNPDELHAEMAIVIEQLQASDPYIAHFKEAFGDQPVNAKQVAMALATFQRTLRSSGRSDFDKFLTGEKDKLSDAAVRGLHLFRTAARCANCHHGPLLSDNQFHDLGLSYYGRKFEDMGRYKITQQPQDVGKFKTPSLRNVTRTAPYMHLGLFNLKGVLNMYNAGMATLRRKPHQQDDPLFPTKSHLLRPLGLNRHDMADLQAFLEAMEEPFRRIRPPALPPIVEQEILEAPDEPDTKATQ